MGLLVAYLGVQVSASSQPASPQAPPLVWSDDFESYTAGDTYTTGFPTSNWQHSGLKDMFVYTDTYASPDQSLKGHGILGECGGSAAYRAIGGYAPMEIEVWIRNGGSQPQSLSGCHPVYGALELSTAPSWEGDQRGLISFAYEENEGTPVHRIYGGAWEVDDTAPRIYLQDYELATWYKVKVRYEIVDAGNVRLTYWIDDAQVGQQDVPTKAFEGNLAYLGLWVGEWVAWHDDVAVYAGGEAPATADLALVKSASPAAVEPGEAFAYSLEITNNGPDEATGIVVSDPLPAGVTFQGATPAGANCQANGNLITCTPDPLASGASLNITLNVSAPAEAAIVNNTAAVTHGAFDSDLSNNEDTVTVRVGTVYTVYLPATLRR